MARKPLKSPPPEVARRKFAWQKWSISSLLIAIVAVTFLPALSLGFLHFDDDIYVWQNQRITSGLTAENVDWAWTHSHAGNWHPLTTLSHMLDCQIYGLHAWGHHLGNLILHALAAVLVFLVLKQMTGRIWAAAAVAAIFAVHPLRVESVVWVAERKDVLCGVFFWLTIAAYIGYARRPFSAIRYSLVVLSFALALLSKPMAVTLPLLMLLLDYWPLARARRWSALVLEKLPLAAMSLASCVVTVVVQREAVRLNEAIPFSARAANALMSCQSYLLQTIWPAGLAAHYPFPRQAPSLPAMAAAAIVLLTITTVTIAQRRSRPYLIVGWLWYLGMLIPVIGLVQVGRQAMADRYTYLPQIGLLWMIVFTAADFIAARPRLRPPAALIIAMLISALSVVSWQQTRFWRDDMTLLQRALDCHGDDSEMLNDMAAALVDKADFAAALPYAQRAVQLDPDSSSGHANLAVILMGLKQADAAVAAARWCADHDPGNAEFHFLHGNALMSAKRYSEAVEQFQAAMRLQPSARYRAQLRQAIIRQKQAESQKP